LEWGAGRNTHHVELVAPVMQAIRRGEVRVDLASGTVSLVDVHIVSRRVEAR
jgi:hypothetical protein